MSEKPITEAELSLLLDELNRTGDIYPQDAVRLISEVRRLRVELARVRAAGKLFHGLWEAELGEAVGPS